MVVNIVDSCQFGQVVVSGQKYTSDVIIFPDGVRDNWRRKRGHQLCLDDIAEVMTGNPEVLVVGTGASSGMMVLPEVQQAAQAKGIKLIVEATEKACRTYNHICHSQRAVAALHITC